MKRELKVIEYIITLEDDGTGIKYNSLVPVPAIQVDFDYFESEQKEIDYFTDIKEEERIITGPIMIPDLKMIRKFQDGSGYYYCRFSSESIINATKKSAKEENFNFVSYNHWKKISEIDASKPVQGVYLIESYFLNERNKSELYSHLPNGTRIGTYWIENDEVWEAIKRGEVKGFSVEVKVNKMEEDKIKSEIMSEIESIINDDTLNKEEKFEYIDLLLPRP